MPVAPRVEVDDDHDDENEEGGERRKRRRGTTTARTAQLRLAEMRAVAVRNKNSTNHYSVQTQQNTNDTNDNNNNNNNNNNASLPPVATRGILSAKQLGKGFLGTMTRPDVVFFGFADNAADGWKWCTDFTARDRWSWIKKPAPRRSRKIA